MTYNQLPLLHPSPRVIAHRQAARRGRPWTCPFFRSTPSRHGTLTGEEICAFAWDCLSVGRRKESQLIYFLLHPPPPPPHPSSHLQTASLRRLLESRWLPRGLQRTRRRRRRFCSGGRSVLFDLRIAKA